MTTPKPKLEPELRLFWRDAEHLYELALEHFQASRSEGVCFYCLQLKKKLEKFIGKSEVNRIKKTVNLYPYCKKKR